MTGDTRPYHSETHSDDRYDCWPISFRLGSRGHITTPLHMTGHTRSTPYDWWHTQKSVEFSCDSWRGVSTVTDIVTNERQCLWCYERETMSDIKDSWRGVSTVNTLQHTATHCNTLQHTATHCNTLQHTATHCNTLQLLWLLTRCVNSVNSHLLPHLVTLDNSHLFLVCCDESWRGQQSPFANTASSSKLYVSSAEYRLFYRALLQKRPAILRPFANTILWLLTTVTFCQLWLVGACDYFFVLVGAYDYFFLLLLTRSTVTFCQHNLGYFVNQFCHESFWC